MSETKKNDMPNWHKFIDSFLSGRQNRPDKDDRQQDSEKGNPRPQLDVIKKSERND